MRSTQYLNHYQPMIETLIKLLDPFAEIAVHDLKKGTLIAIYNNISKRSIGDKTPLKELNVDTSSFPDSFAPYFKTNWDGRKLKCTTITVRNEDNHPVALICINIDVSFFADTKNILDRFLQTKKEAKNPIELFGGSYQEQITHLIEKHLKKESLTLQRLKKQEKKTLVHTLYHKGAFNYKNAVPFVAQSLKVSRATIYNYLKELFEE